ncbi:MAG: SusC/RagA family TonB-linked outer membrane protein [Chitinophagaceae bacterium]|nr:SusC/RagA family TonB-linked outer membrane protein [Chitinophagaceae bacterium]
MRASILAILLSASGLLLAGNGSGQDLDKVIVTVDFKNATLKNALQKIEKLTQLSFTYKTGDVSPYGNINYQASGQALSRVLNEILQSTELQYEQVNSNIVIKKVRRDDRSATNGPTGTPAPLYDGVIRGRITNEQGDPVANASVELVGTSKGVVANSNGEFVISGVQPGNYQLRISAIGFQEEIRSVSARDNEEVQVTFQLKDRSNNLSEVVVTALGITRKQRSLGYATQQVKGENLTLTKEQNVLGSLAGKIAGVQVTGASGASMGGTQKIKIRGVNSIGGTDQPLIVVDGTPISNANFASADKADYGNLGQDVNPEDIESVNVLKGPAASALYGIRGQYGVILITTKKGAKGAKNVNVQLNSAFSFEKAGNFIPLQNMYGGGSSQTWRTLPNGEKYVDMSVDESWGPRMDGTPARQIFSFYPLDAEYGKLTPFIAHPNNVEDFFRTGTTINNGITVSGGGENSTFRLSFNDARIEGVEPNTWLRRNNVGLSAGLDLSKKLRLMTNINYATNKAQRPTQGSEYGARYMVQWFQRNVDMNRLKDYQYSDGTFLNWNLNRPSATTGLITNFKPLYWDNPYFDSHENLNNDNRDRFFGDIGLTYDLLPGLKVSGFLRADMFMQNIEERTAFGGRRLPAYSVGKYQNKELNYEFLAQYNKNWGDFSLNANLGANMYKRRYTYLTQATVGGLSAPGFFNIAASIDRPVNNSYLLRKEIRSMYGMASVGYKDTYFIDVSLRNDNTSTLPENNNSYWYPSISGSFVFSELVKWDPLSFGKLRLSYAKAGSDLNAYQTSYFYNVGSIYTPAGGTSINTLTVPDNLANPTIQPSFANSYEMGLELRFFKNRLGADLTYYAQKNRKQIIQLDVSGASGFGSTTINAGLIENKGFELTLTGTPIQTKNFSWNSTFNISRNKNMVVELYPGINTYGYGSTTYSSVTTFLNSYVGRPFGSLVGPAYKRDSATGKMLLGANNLPLFTESTYDFGSVLPDYTGGFQNFFRLGKFELAAMIDFQFGGQFFSRSKMLAVRTGQDASTVVLNDKGKNIRDAVADGGGVRVDGISDITKQPVTAYIAAQTYFGTTARRIYEDWVYDASYIKLREIRLGYTFDKSSISKLPFAGVTLALIARNPAMLWQKAPKGLDPSELSTGSQSIGWYESGQTNTVRSFGVSLNVNF